MRIHEKLSQRHLLVKSYQYLKFVPITSEQFGQNVQFWSLLIQSNDKNTQVTFIVLYTKTIVHHSA